MSLLPEYVGIPRESCAIRMIGTGPKACLPNRCSVSACNGLCKTWGFTTTIPKVTPCSRTRAPWNLILFSPFVFRLIDESERCCTAWRRRNTLALDERDFSSLSSRAILPRCGGHTTSLDLDCHVFISFLGWGRRQNCFFTFCRFLFAIWSWPWYTESVQFPAKQPIAYWHRGAPDQGVLLSSPGLLRETAYQSVAPRQNTTTKYGICQGK